jgi:hypothetical protein
MWADAVGRLPGCFRPLASIPSTRIQGLGCQIGCQKPGSTNNPPVNSGLRMERTPCDYVTPNAISRADLLDPVMGPAHQLILILLQGPHKISHSGHRRPRQLIHDRGFLLEILALFTGL